MSEAKEQLIGRIVDWFQFVFGWSDSEVGMKAMHEERGSAKGPRPPLPFLTYSFTILDLADGMEENVYRPTGYAVTGGRTATLSIVGYGEGTDDWLARLGMSTQAAPEAITLENLSPILDISEFDETNIEARFAKDFTVFYRLTLEDPDRPVLPKVWAEKILYNNEEIIP